VHREVEVKMRVPSDFDVTRHLDDLDGCTASGPTTVRMRGAYHDTRDLTLLRWGITMRRREGGADAGWHMKLPVSGSNEGTRDELHLPLSRGSEGAAPSEFVAIVSPLLRGREIVHLADVDTMRTTYTVVDASGHALVEIADDQVSVERGGEVISAFHEIEVELLDSTDPASMEVLHRIQERVMRAGAAASGLSKVASALGPLASAPPDVPDMGVPARDCLAVDLIRQVIADHTRHLLLADVGIRRGVVDSVHQMRVAARRLRSSLRSFEPLLDADQAQRLREELAWIASELGAVRDLEVLLGRLVEQATGLDDPEDAERASTAISTELERRLKAAQSSALAALRSDRHADLIEDLIAAASEPPVNDSAFEPAGPLIESMVRRTWTRLAKDVRGLVFTAPSTEWHEVRILAKKARYTADAAALISGRSMRTFAQHLATVTDILGDMHDAHVAQMFLRELAGAPQVTGQEGLALGRLLDVQQQCDLDERERFEKAWPSVRDAARSAGVR
jgi:CHAD domain-containing protein